MSHVEISQEGKKSIKKYAKKVTQYLAGLVTKDALIKVGEEVLEKAPGSHTAKAIEQSLPRTQRLAEFERTRPQN